MDDVNLKLVLLGNLANLSSEPDQAVGPAEAAVYRSRLNTLYAQNGRNPDTSCTICLEPLEQPGGGADVDTAGHGGRGAEYSFVHMLESGHPFHNSSVHVLECGHQFHNNCLHSWWDTRSDRMCPLCKK